ncbi:hypothetical protein ACFFKU_06735 [Kineococcus gynurae]|uniref:RiboL-PSP-HEPN domain-containing protein n=1 Tax=Kineococcus gynurae TaxID=452979 RepID=A0ABV5LX02_9ACTN
MSSMQTSNEILSDQRLQELSSAIGVMVMMHGKYDEFLRQACVQLAQQLDPTFPTSTTNEHGREIQPKTAQVDKIFRRRLPDVRRADSTMKSEPRARMFVAALAHLDYPPHLVESWRIMLMALDAVNKVRNRIVHDPWIEITGSDGTPVWMAAKDGRRWEVKSVNGIEQVREVVQTYDSLAPRFLQLLEHIGC